MADLPFPLLLVESALFLTLDCIAVVAQDLIPGRKPFLLDPSVEGGSPPDLLPVLFPAAVYMI